MSQTVNRGLLLAPPFPRVHANGLVPGNLFNQAMAAIERAIATINVAIPFGATTQRPQIPTSEAATLIGKPYFDTTLGIPISWNGTAWVDATGTPV